MLFQIVVQEMCSWTSYQSVYKQPSSEEDTTTLRLRDDSRTVLTLSTSVPETSHLARSCLLKTAIAPIISWSHHVSLVNPMGYMVQLNLNLTFTLVWKATFWTDFLCHLRVTRKQIIKIYIYMHVTLESLNKFIGSLTSCTQGVNKFVLLLASCTQALNKFVEPFASCTQVHELMHSWSVLLVRNILRYV